MSLDKTIKRKTMNDLVKIEKAKEEFNLDVMESDNGIVLPINLKSTLDLDKWKEYNSKAVKELDKNYSENIEILNGEILVRLLKKPVVSKNGLAIPHNTVKTLRNGATARVKDNLAFNFVGVVVNYDKSYEDRPYFKENVKKGTVVQIRPHLVMTQVFGEDEGIQYLTNCFWRYEDNEKNYSELGYVLIKYQDINVILKDFDIDNYVGNK